MLIKSESQRIANDISPNILTQVDHFEYSLLLSKTGSIPIDNIVKQTSGKIQSEFKFTQTDEGIEEITKKTAATETIEKSAQTDYFLLEDNIDSFYTDNKGNQYYIAEIFNELTQKLTFHSQKMELPTAIKRLIKNDLAKKPLETGERSYKIVINKSLTQPGKKPEVVRILIRNIKELTDRFELPKIRKAMPAPSPSIENVSAMRYLTQTSPLNENNYKVFMVKNEKSN